MSTAAQDMREYLEAAIRRRWPASDRRPVAAVNQAVEEILRAADLYRAAGHPGRPPALVPVCAAARDRRARGRAAAEFAAPVHWQKPCSVPNTAACHGKVTTAQVTSLRAQVTCEVCVDSQAWRVSLAGAA